MKSRRRKRRRVEMGDQSLRCAFPLIKVGEGAVGPVGKGSLSQC